MDDIDEPGESRPWWRKLEWGGVLLAAISGVLYLLGVVFHMAYLESFRIAPGLYPLPVHAAIGVGVQALVRIGIVGLIGSFLAIVAFLGVGVAVAWILDQLRAWSDRVLADPSRKAARGFLHLFFAFTDEESRRSQQRWAAVNRALDGLLRLGAAVGVACVLLVVGYLSWKAGEDLADSTRQVCASDQKETSGYWYSAPDVVKTAVRMRAGNPEVETTVVGCIIESSEVMLSVYDGTQTITLPTERLVDLRAAMQGPGGGAVPSSPEK